MLPAYNVVIGRRVPSAPWSTSYTMADSCRACSIGRSWVGITGSQASRQAPRPKQRLHRTTRQPIRAACDPCVTCSGYADTGPHGGEPTRQERAHEQVTSCTGCWPSIPVGSAPENRWPVAFRAGRPGPSLESRPGTRGRHSYWHWGLVLVLALGFLTLEARKTCRVWGQEGKPLWISRSV